MTTPQDARLGDSQAGAPPPHHTDPEENTVTPTTNTAPTEGRCARCQQTRVAFPAKPEWGRVPSPLCTSDWQMYADARANGTFVDWNDAFDNATDEQLERGIAAGAEGSAR